VFLGVVSWLTFAYHFVYDNAAAVFMLYAFANVMFAIAMIYTRRQALTRIATLFMHPLILVMLVYGFWNWYLILPPFIVATVIFFASGVGESLKVILGTIYMILFVLTCLGYITLESLTIKIPLKMDLHLREHATVSNAKSSPFRLVAYVDPETKENRRADFYIERTDSDIRFWNLTCEKVAKSTEERAGTLVYCENVFGGDGSPSYELKWENSGKTTMLNFGGRPIEIDSRGRRIVEELDETDNDFASTASTRSPTAVTGRSN